MTTLLELLDEYVICRTVGHSWDENPSPEVDSDWWKYSRAALYLRCTRCHTERFDYLGREFEVLYRRYRYPGQYRGVRGIKRPDLRGELFRRSLLLRRRRAPKGGR